MLGADGLPAPANAGNVLRPKTQLVLSLRLPPTVDASAAGKKMKELLEENPPYGAKVSYEYGQAANGWHSPQLAPWLAHPDAGVDLDIAVSTLDG